jgi:CubicO group peptidase (beta-lactamase class C family)
MTCSDGASLCGLMTDVGAFFAGVSVAEELEEQLASALEATGVVGASLGVLSGDEVEIAHAGLADVVESVEVTDATRFQIASITKPMVATVIAKLVAEGRFGLRDTTATLIPELREGDWGEQVAVLDLLANRGGIPLTAAVEFEFDAEEDNCLARLAAAVAPEPLLFEPRTGWSYSNTAWCLLGRIIETICRTSWEEAMWRELFDPLELVETCFISEGPVPTAAPCYDQRGGSDIAVDPWPSSCSRAGRLDGLVDRP